LINDEVGLKYIDSYKKFKKKKKRTVVIEGGVKISTLSALIFLLF